jgi:hypothetical protein
LGDGLGIPSRFPRRRASAEPPGADATFPFAVVAPLAELAREALLASPALPPQNESGLNGRFSWGENA